MSFPRSPDKDDRSLFEQAMREVDRLPPGKERVPGRKGPAPSRRPLPAARPVRFAVERRGEHHEGLAPGADPRQLRRLRDGELPVEIRLNVRRMREAAAHAAVAGALAQAVAEGRRCLLIVHGRGRASAGEPILKSALPAWLSERPHGRRVLAFTSAPPALGGTGATLVLLRKKR